MADLRHHQVNAEPAAPQRLKGTDQRASADPVLSNEAMVRLSGDQAPAVRLPAIMALLSSQAGNQAIARAVGQMASTEPAAVPPGFADALSSGGAGVPLPDGFRQGLETGTGAALDRVRVHTDDGAATLAASVGARAFTLGQDIYFGQGEYAPASSDGYRLLAHEVAHTIQQAGAAVPAAGALVVGAAGSPAEQHADAVADELDSPASGTPLIGQVGTPGTVGEVHRHPALSASAPAEIRREPAESAPADPPSAVSPEDRMRQLYAATTMREVPALDAQTKSDLGKAISYAPLYAQIQDRDRKRAELSACTEELDKANTELSIASVDVHDVPGGAPGGSDPGSGEPERAMRRLEAAKLEKARLSGDVDSLSSELKGLDAAVKTQLQALGVKSDEDLVNFVQGTFPQTFAARGKQIAIATLEANRRAAEKERDRYRQQQGNVGDRAALRAAATDLDARTKDIAAIWATRTSTLPPGGADADDPGVRELADIQARVQPLQDELDKKRAEYQVRFPILFKVDAQQIAAARDAELDALLDGPVTQVLANIDKTEGNIAGDQLKVWKLRGASVDIVALTKDDLGIKANDTLDMVVEQYAAEDKTTGEMVTDALNALSMVADVIGVLTGPVGMAVAGGVAAVAMVAQVAQDYQTASRLQAAGGVAIDPAAEKLVADQPDLSGLVTSILMAGAAVVAAAGGIVAVVNQFRKAQQAAKDLEEFEKLIRDTSLPDEVKKRLVAEAQRQFAKAPVLDAAQLRREFDAISHQFTLEEKVATARIVAAYGQEAAAKTFLELEGTQIFKLTEQNIDAALEPVKAAELKARHFGPHARPTRGVTLKSRGRPVAFIQADSYASVAEAVDHEVVHVFQQRYEQYYTATYAYYTEHQAYLQSQRFLQNARAQLGQQEFDKAFADSLWLVDADDAVITKHIRDHYGPAFTPAPHIAIDRDDMNALLEDYIKQDEATRQKHVMQALERELDRD